MLGELLGNTFLKEIEDVIKAQNFKEPPTEVTSHERIVGQMNDLEKALYTLAHSKGKLLELLKIKLVFDDSSPEEADTLGKTLCELDTQRETYKTLFWAVLNSRLQLWDGMTGVRKKFQVVWRESPIEESESVIALLKKD